MSENKQNQENTDVENLLNPEFKLDVFDFFENFLKPGVITKEKEIAPNFKIKLKALNTEELLVAESIISNGNPHLSPDVVVKVRSASILSRAILAINDLPIEKEELNESDNESRRFSLYKQILKMPPLLIQKTYEFYIEAVHEQNQLYTSDNLGKNIENF